MFEIVDLSAKLKLSKPDPVNSTNFPTTPFSRSISTILKTKSVAVAPSGSFPFNLKPTTSGTSIEIGCPNIAASASIPPTPQPRTAKQFTIVVWLSVPTKVSGKAKSFPLISLVQIVLARYSRFT